MITHYDLFAGIGGFSYALDQVFHEQKINHIFCEWEAFPTAVLKKHWPDATYYGDIANLVTDTERFRLERSRSKYSEGHTHERSGNGETKDQVIVTGGFPCQPFSQAGRRKGTADDRYKWPDMFAVIQNVRPDWVIAENVRGLVTWNDGMVLETVCTDLENEGYEVQPIVIPACALGAPHRRDRVWIIANRRSEEPGGISGFKRQEVPQTRQSNQVSTTNTRQQHGEQGDSKKLATSEAVGPTSSVPYQRGHQPDWKRDWREVAFATCYDGVDDGLPRWMDGIAISASRHRKERLKCCGNAIVPQVAIEIFKNLKLTYEY